MPDKLTLLLTDLVDSTRLNEEIGDAAMRELWSAHDSVARGLLRTWQGREVGRSDGLLALFDEPKNAVQFALHYHRAIAQLPVRVQARVGLHQGLVTLRENRHEDTVQGATPFEVDGVALPVAARVMSAALGGQTLTTSSTLSALGNLPVRAQSHGHWRLKGLTDPVELFEIGEPDAPFLPPPDSPKAYRVVLLGRTWTTLQSLPNNLPAERDTFVGRQQPLRSIASAFEGGARLVSVLGMGGIGKTRLALRYARAWLGDYPGGAWFCDLSQARTLDGIVHAVAQGLQVPLGKGDPVTQLGVAIAGRGACLLVLDNFEQVSRHAEECVGQWLERAPSATLLITSREVLGIAGEHAFSLPPLPASEATALFEQRARAACDSYEPDAESQAAVTPLVQLLDGLPLAIELAAARVRVMPPPALLQRMGERFKLLSAKGGRRDRQATLRATIDWSWDLLSEAERSALAQLAVFEGGFALPAAEAVLDLSTLPRAPWPADVLQALVEKSLLRVVPGSRFDLLRSVHDYAVERLALQGEGASSACAARHWQHFAGFDEHRAIAERCADIDNLIAACRRASEAGDAAAAVGTLVLSWAALNLIGPLAAIVPMVQRVRSMPGMGDAQHALLDWVDGKAQYRLGHGVQALAAFQNGLAAAERVADPALLSRLHCAIAGPLSRLPARAEDAHRHLNLALELAEATQDRELLYWALNALGNFCFEASLLDEAELRFGAALVHARRLGHRRWIGGLLGNLGLVCHFQRRPAKAIAYYREALQIAQDIGDRQWAGNTHSNLGLLLHEEGDHGQARQHLESALSSARDQGHTRLESTVLCNLGLVALAQAQAAPACAQFDAAAELAAELGDHRLEAECRRYLARAFGLLLRFDEARAALEASRRLGVDPQNALALALAYCELAGVETHAGKLAEAGRELGLARELCLGLSGAEAAMVEHAIDEIWHRLHASTAAAAGITVR